MQILNGLVSDTNSIACKSIGTVTRPATNNAYAANDVVGSANTNNIFSNVLGVPAKRFIITGVTMEFDSNAIPTGMGNFKLHLYDAAPTVIADEAAFNLPAADRTKYLGYIPLVVPTDLVDTCWSQNDNVNFNGQLVTSSLYWILTTDNIYTPTASLVITITLYASEA